MVTPRARAYLVLTAAVAGALVMVVEVTGSRVLGPFFGVSLFVWTSLITVTLVALALGYAAGGFASDRCGSPDALYAIVATAGVAALLVPALKAPVLRACAPLGLRTGALLAAALLFGPCLFLLGSVSPYVVKLAAVDMSRLGRTVGLLYAVSTLGSFAGTLLTGFVLIAHVGVAHTFTFAGAALVALAVGHFALFRRSWPALLALAYPFLAWQPEPFTRKVMANGTAVAEVARREGFYGTVQVLDYSYGPVRTREMVIDGLVQGGIDLGSRLSPYEYSYWLEHLPRAMNSAGRTCLVIGLGAGLVPSWYQARGVLTDVVDVNPDVVALARDHFAFSTRGEVAVEDARAFLARPGRRYDYVILDVFTGDTTPGHLLTLEALQLVRARLSTGGILAINLIGSLRREAFMTASIVKTLAQTFATVEVYPTFDPGQNDFGNLVLVAHDGPPLPFDPARSGPIPVHPLARERVERLLGSRFAFPAGSPAIVLTDDYNPIDVYDAWLKEQLRTQILEATDWDTLL